MADVLDTFTRTESNGWGTADVGGAWTVNLNSTANWSTNGSIGICDASTQESRIGLNSLSLTDVDALVKFKLASAPGGNRAFQIWCRSTESPLSDYRFNIRWDNANTRWDVFVFKRIAGGSQANAVSGTFVNSGVTAVADSWFWVRAQAIDESANVRFRVRLWADGGSEPGTWLIDEAVTREADAGRLMIHGGSGGGNPWSFDDLAVNDTTNQFLYPSATEQAGSWTSTEATLHAALALKNDTTYISLTEANMPSTARVKLESGVAPEAGDRTWRARVARTGTANIAFTVTLREGGGSTLGGGTLKGTASTTRSADGFATATVVITDSISNYADLYAEITADVA